MSKLTLRCKDMDSFINLIPENFFQPDLLEEELTDFNKVTVSSTLKEYSGSNKDQLGNQGRSDIKDLQKALLQS